MVERDARAEERRVWPFLLLALGGVGLRLLLVMRGNNGDLNTVFEIAGSPWGTNFYKAFPYYANWGPVMYWIFQGVYRLPGGDQIGTFHLYVAVLFALCDVFSGWVLWRIFGIGAAGFFLLMPAEMIVSGYHCNAEPGVIACVIGAMWFAKEREEGKTSFWFYALIGVSLAVKHAFLLFPVWLVMTRGSWRRKFAGLAIPYATYLVIILPFLIPSPRFWIRNVAMYSAWSGNGLIPRAVVGVLELMGVQTIRVAPLVWVALFVVPLLGVGYLARRMDKRSLLILYGPALVGLSSAMALQYLALPAYSFAARADAAAWVYNLFSAWLMGGHPDELGLWRLPVKLTVNFDNRGFQLLQWVCLIWVGMRLRKHRRGVARMGGGVLSTEC